MISKSNDEARRTNDDGSTNVRMMKLRSEPSHRHSDLVIPSGFDIRPSSLASSLIATGSQLTDVLKAIEPADRVAIDTEADSLHCYKEKLCLLQISVPTRDAIVDPLANVDLAPLRDARAGKEIVPHGADCHLRLPGLKLN